MTARRLPWSATKLILQVEAEIVKPDTHPAGVAPIQAKGAKKKPHLWMRTGRNFANRLGTAPGQG